MGRGKKGRGDADNEGEMGFARGGGGRGRGGGEGRGGGRHGATVRGGGGRNGRGETSEEINNGRKGKGRGNNEKQQVAIAAPAPAPAPGRGHRGDGRNHGRDNGHGGRGRGRNQRDHQDGRGRGGRFYVQDVEPQYHNPAVANQNEGVDARVLGFCKSLGNTPFLITRQNIELWEAAFELSPTYPSLRNYIPKLLKSYLKFPDQSGYAPKPETVLKLLSHFLPQCRAIDDLELVLDTVKERLRRSSSMGRVSDKALVSTLLQEVSSQWKKSFLRMVQSDYDKRLLTFAQQFEETILLYESSINNLVIQDSNHECSSVDRVHQWAASPTLEWLMDGSLYERISLKKSYTDAEDYVATVRKVWVMLTFYWGSAAFWPKCGCQSNTGVGDARACGTPLLTPITNGNAFCTKRGTDGRCGRPAVWKCMRRDHDAICRRCLLVRQKNFLGPAGVNASTDVYDGTINSIQLTGDAHVLHLRNIMSRKPPKEKVNWKTSYRLQPSMLVGIIHLHGRNLELHPSMKIYWGEIIAKNKQSPLEEYKHRENGDLSVRLLSRSDCPDLVNAHDIKFTRDSYVAVIDMRVFVPEVMTVLSTLGQKSFLDGFTRVAFSEYLRAPDFQEQRQTLPLELSSSTLYEQLEIAFNITTVDCIAKFSEDRKRNVLGQICNLKMVKTLDRTQREAFVNALLRPLHCTQGPPGTGKSYVGVCLVLALMIIRQALKETGSHVGPILALSYKNHAIDEFLVDVLKNNSKLATHGKLVRLGKPENELLLNYTEKRSSLETNAHRELESRLYILKIAYGKLQRWIQSRDIAVTANETEVAECLMISFLYQSKYLDDEHTSSGDSELEDSESDSEEYLNETKFEDLKSLLLESSTPRLENAVPLICKGVQHWKFVDERPRDIVLLGRWIAGDFPPPRCRAYVVDDSTRQRIQCSEALSTNGFSYCERYHSCSFQSCEQLRSPLSPRFCDDHRCAASQFCENARVSPIAFCRFHCCVVCLVNEREIGFVCRQHCCKVNTCQNAVIGRYDFCIDHCCPTCIELKVISETSCGEQQSKYCRLHRCKFSGCHSKVEYETGYCRKHTCKFCHEPVCLGSTCCVFHKCSFSFEDCSQNVALTKSGRVSKFCELHTCKFCVLDGCDLDKEVSPPSYTCCDHPICIAVLDDGSECSNLATHGSMYCENHLQSVSGNQYCSGITKKGKPCRASRPSDCLLTFYYCKDHIKQSQSRISKVESKTVTLVFTSLHQEDHRPWRSPNMKKVDICRCGDPECSIIIIDNSADKYCKFHSLIHHLIKSNENENQSVFNPALDAKSEERNLGSQLSNLSFEECKGDQPLDEDISVDQQVCGNNNDEVDMENPDDFDQDEVPDQTKHFDEIYQEEHDETVELEFDETLIKVQDIDELDLDECVENLKDCFLWTWEMSTAQRQQAVFKLVTAVCRLFTDFIHYAEAHVDEARQLKAEASAHILKEASVIGGTVVGAARRLAALRAAEPFAIIVEEACEVMEPTLVAVLAVESVKKLELIGDHRQLPAFVNQCWYNLECSIPSIKTSLFERIIMTENNQGVVIQRRDNVCSILDIQRRMRTCISNLTRGEYQDLVAIEDHPATGTQKIGDKLSTVPKSRKYWEFGGRSVPGLQSCIYFWNMENNSESRPIAGLSACNENEGLAVVELVKYLTLCGVPEESITIITPYDGQKRLLIQLLRKQNCLPKQRAENTIRVSTVDRYQGDENDIVILSLVRTRPGNRFVGLLNRFIVATSRARLGFFIIGSVSAVVHNNEGPRHWKTFIEHLSHPDTSGCDPFHGSRVGSALPICCPLHHNSVATISSVRDKRVLPTPTKWNSFCKMKCLAELECGHLCQLSCHLPELESHTSHCEEKVNRPCSYHSTIPILCHKIPRKKGQTVDDALKSWRCDHPENFELDCGHETTLPCSEIQDILSKKKKSPRCEVLVDDFVYPSCGHKISNPKCWERQQYLVSPPKCEVKVVVKRSCGHKKELKCFQDDEGYCERIICKEVIHCVRPRCKHPLNIRCQDYKLLRDSIVDEYDDVRVENGMTIVEERGEYGPSESTFLLQLPPCKVEVKYTKNCGHSLMMKCDDAFKLVAYGTIDCDDPSQVKCLLCHGNVLIPCRYVEAYLSVLGNYDGIVETNPTSSVLQTSESRMSILSNIQDQSPWFLLKRAKCDSKILLQRECHPNHRLEVSCLDLLRIFVLREKTLQTCVLPFPISLECGHSIDVNCSKRNKAPPFCQRPNFEEFQYPHCEHTSTPKTCGDLRRLRNDPNVKCTRDVECLLPRCHHPIVVKCFELPLIVTAGRDGNVLPIGCNTVLASEVYCQACSIAPPCRSVVTFQFDCGHQIDNISCSDAFNWADDPSQAPACATLVPWCNPLCRHEMQIHCAKSSILSLWNPWDGVEKPDFDHLTIGEKIVQVISYPPPVFPNLDPNVLNWGISCNTAVAAHFARCGHVRLVSCHELYSPQKPLKCTETVEVECQKCNLSRKLSCYDIQNKSCEELNSSCKNKCNKLCQVCKITSLSVPCNQREVCCNRDVECTLGCGHQAKWKCGKDEDPRLSYDAAISISLNCKICASSRWQIDNDLELDLNCMLETCRRMFAEAAAVGDTCTILDESVLVDLASPDSPILTRHETARHHLISKLQDAITNGSSKIVFPNPHDSFEGYIRSNYRLVYLPIPLANNPDANQLLNRLQPDATPYGRGKQISVFHKRSLTKMAALVNGQVKLCVALAFQANVLTNIPPFILGQGSKELNQRANKSSLQFMNQGYDAVEMTQDDSIEMVYWNHAAILPLLSIKIQLTTSCPICGDFFSQNGDDGVVCPNTHFQCYDCFRQYLEAAKQPDAINTYINAVGEVTCPDPSCRCGYSLYQLSSIKCPQDIFQTLQTIKLDHELRKNEALVRQEAEEKMKLELERIQRMSEEEREIHIKRQHIITDILTPKCPRCKQAFIDFNGCFALTCANNQCRCGFCAWCFKDCGDDAHQHVANCQWSTTQGVFGNITALDQVWNRIRKQKINEYLGNCDRKIRTKVLDSLKKEFDDIKLVV